MSLIAVTEDPMAAPDAVVTISGVLYIILASVFFTINAFLLAMMFRNPEYQTATYRIIKCIYMACMIQLSIFIVGGAMTLADSVFNEKLNKVLGAILQASWFLYLGLSLSLAIDRLLCFVVFSPKKCSLVNAVILAASWLIGFAYLIAFLIPGFGFGYCCVNHQYLHWFYLNEPGAQILKATEVVLDFIVLSLVLLIYIIVFAYLMKMRKNKANGNETAKMSLKIELRILVSSIISFVYEATYLLWFFWGSNFLADSSYRHIVTTFLWIAECGLFSVTTIVINSSVRNRVKTIMVTTRTTTATRF
uniref:G_PROTEIN_RECEP_F1_2 domain-containing protein n=1 Tax=Steinernema glaseri TaxID=37863 RepID=A0A1I8AWP2_9BILA